MLTLYQGQNIFVRSPSYKRQVQSTYLEEFEDLMLAEVLVGVVKHLVVHFVDL